MPKDAQYVVTIDDGGYTVAPADPDAPVLWTLTPADAEALQAGSLDLNVAFMQGRAKAAGDGKALLEFLTRSQSLRR